jgi:1-pyrroline-5-carboxylate dehydrogenase
VERKIKDRVAKIRAGDPADPKTIMGAVIDEKSFDLITSYIEAAKKSPDVKVIAGGGSDKTKGYFIEPTVLLCADPKYATMETELFGPVMSVYVYDDDKFGETLKLCDETSVYGLTGSIFGSDRYAINQAVETLRYAAGNFYINDKTTGAMVGQQPFGGSRASGTNDKVGSQFNLIRWLNPRSIKENYAPPTEVSFPHMGD